MTQDIVLESLFKTISKGNLIGHELNALVITGDVAFSGKAEEYLKAKDFISKILQTCRIKTQNLFVIPGNHDVDRTKIKPEHLNWWYNFVDEKSLNENLQSEDSFPKIMAKTKAYFEFACESMSSHLKMGKFGEFVSDIFIDGDDIPGITFKIVGLNSAIFCGYDGDEKGRLALGLEQVNVCESGIDEKRQVIITCLHHPFNCYHSCDGASLNVLQRFSDLILSGHVHMASNSAMRAGNSGETVMVTAGAAYEERTVQNGFNVIKIDTKSLKGKVIFYKYLPSEHRWILNRDINPETDGEFQFAIKKAHNDQISEVNGLVAEAPSVQCEEYVRVDEGTNETRVTGKYMLVLDGSFDGLNRERVAAVLEHLKMYTKDVNATITKMEEGSIKIYFETDKEVTESFDELTEINGLKIIQVTKVGNKENNVSKADKSVFHWRTFLKPEFYENIDNPGATFAHSRVDDLKLKDLFVSPNLRKIKIDENEREKIDMIVNAEVALTKKSGVPIKTVIYGADNSGKSTLAKWWYDTYYEAGYIPILISGNSIKEVTLDRIKRIVTEEFYNQYTGILERNLDEYEKDRIILIIDDFHRIRFSKVKFKANLLANINKAYDNVLITGSDLMKYEVYTSKNGHSRNLFDDFVKYQIVEFGPKLRYELIKKWNSLGSEQLDSNELIRLNNETESHVESIIGKNFVPSYPVYLLTILQAREATSLLKPEYSLHGFYYELLINDALSRGVRVKQDISLYYNFITDYCFFLFDQQIRLQPLVLNDFIEFHEYYCKEYNINVTHKLIITTLSNSKLLKLVNQSVSISYKYVYYFFVARYLANNISNPDIKHKIKLLCERVHRDEYSNIVMFLTHLSKDQFILNELLINSKSLFSTYKPIQLDDDVAFINEMIGKLPEQIYKPVDIVRIKEDELKLEDDLDAQEREFNSSKDVYEYDLNEDLSTLDVITNMTKAVRTIEIVGQVTKKYWGELKAPQKLELAEETYMLGLRTLSFYFSLLEQDTGLLVEYLMQLFKKRNTAKDLSREQVDKASRNYLFGLCAMSSYGIIKTITNAIGYDKLGRTFQDILEINNFTSVRLIDTSIKLDHNKGFPWDEVKRLKDETEKNFLSKVVLRNLVINYLYIFHTSIEDKQRICSLVDIKIAQQLIIDATSAIKKE